MSKRKINGALYFNDDEVIGHFTIGTAHYEIAGVRRPAVRPGVVRRKAEAEEEDRQGDMFNEDARDTG